MSQFQTAINEIDRRNAQDPNHDGDQPKELRYSQRLTDWVNKLTDQPSDQLLLAARAQHIERWKSPRSDYPDGRTGYLQWRKNLQKAHAQTLAQIMKSAGYDDETNTQSTDLILKKSFAKDPQGQILEDAACLLFLQFELAKFAAKTEAGKTIHVLQKTWQKMSESAQQIALVLPLAPNEEHLLKSALNG
jgi:hypothetical protein